MDERQLEQKYGLFTAICMVAGVVIGAGVYFKAQVILSRTGGNLLFGVLAWMLGGAVMLSCAAAFAVIAQRYAGVAGLVEFAAQTVGPGFAYYAGWFLAIIYYPAITSVLGWMSARYTLEFLAACWPWFARAICAEEGGCASGPACLILMLAYLCAACAVNTFAPRLAGKLLTSATVVKLIPLALLAVVGIICGVLCPDRMLLQNASNSPTPPRGALLGGVCAAAFSYEGWIVVASIGGELKDARRNLPRALIAGSLLVITVYIAYYLGAAGGAEIGQLMAHGPEIAYVRLFGSGMGRLLTLFVAISCLGTLDGLMLGCVRGLYVLAARGTGPRPARFSKLGRSNMPLASAGVGLAACICWGLYYYVTSVAQLWTGPFAFDASELPVITLYGFYLPVFFCWMRKSRDEPLARRYLLPSLAGLSAGFMVYACIVSHGMANVWYLVVFGAVMLLGTPFARRR